FTSAARRSSSTRSTIRSYRPMRCPIRGRCRPRSRSSSLPMEATWASSMGRRGPLDRGRSAAPSPGWPVCWSATRIGRTTVMRDVHGLDVTTGSGAALEAYDAATVGLLGWDASALDRFRAAATHDPQLALAHAGAGVCLFLEERFDEARAAIDSARATVAGGSERERSHVEAMARLVTGRPPEAEAAMQAHLETWPRDLLVAQRLYFLWFW